MPDNHFAGYLPLLMHFGDRHWALRPPLFCSPTSLASISPGGPKCLPYECGVQPIGDARGRFSVKFYLVAMLFIFFDVEAVFLYPWAVILRELKMFGFWEMMVYIAIVLVGLFYVWKKGVLDWGLSAAQRGDM